MPISFSSNGSTAGTPTKGLLGNVGAGGLAGLISKPKAPAPQASTITPFVAGTQSKINGEPNLNAPDRGNGTPTAAGNATASGAGYFQGLLNSQNPAERQAGQTWLSHQTTPVLLPSTPVKKITTASDGTTTHEFHAPDTGLTSDEQKEVDTVSAAKKQQDVSNTSSTETPTSAASNTTGNFQVGTPTQNAQNVLDQSSLNNNPEYQALAAQNNALVKASGVASQAPYAGQNQSVGQSLADISRSQTTGNLAGQLGNLNNQISQGLSGNSAEANRLLSGAQLATGGAENVLGASTLSPTSYGQTNTSGLTGVQDSGQYGTGPAAAANVASIKDLTDKYNSGVANLERASGLENQIVSTLTANPSLNSVPITGITNLNELLSGQISSGPQQLLSQQIANYIATLGLDPASVANIAHQQKGTLAQLLDSLKQTATNNNEALKKTADGLSANSSASGSSTGAGLYDF